MLVITEDKYILEAVAKCNSCQTKEYVVTEAIIPVSGGCEHSIYEVVGDEYALKSVTANNRTAVLAFLSGIICGAKA